MQRREGHIIVDQRVDYLNVQHVDEFHLETSATYIALKRYSRISYTDNEGVDIVVKWQQGESDGQMSVEIRQPQYTLVFGTNNSYTTYYPTPQGIWQLKVDTTHLSVEETDEGEIAIEIDYQINMDEGAIANYQFRLIYQ